MRSIAKRFIGGPFASAQSHSISNFAGFAICGSPLRDHRFVWIVAEMLIGKRFEKGKSLALMSL